MCSIYYSFMGGGGVAVNVHFWQISEVAWPKFVTVRETNWSTVEWQNANFLYRRLEDAFLQLNVSVDQLSSSFNALIVKHECCALALLYSLCYRLDAQSNLTRMDKVSWFLFYFRTHHRKPVISRTTSHKQRHRNQEMPHVVTPGPNP